MSTVAVVLIVLAVLVVLVLVWGVTAYNRFVSQRQQIRDAYANVDTELRRRYDLIPNLVETVRGYAAHEREVFEEVARARSMAIQAQGPAQQAQAEDVLTAALGRLFAVAEAYPQLRANENFLQLQNELATTENRIQGSRRFYNANVREYNERVQAVPSNVIASAFDFRQEEYFEIEEAERERVGEAPRVDFGTAAAGQPPGGSASSGPAATGETDRPTSPG